MTAKRKRAAKAPPAKTRSLPPQQQAADGPAPTVAFITTCKGRLHHLKQTLPTLMAEQPDEMIVVDYSCPQGTGDWVEAQFPQAKLIRAGQPDGRFNVSRARNIGAAAATSEWLFFIDADIHLRPGMLEKIRRAVKPGHFYTPWLRDVSDEVTQAFGTFCCRAEDFAAIGGYDEVFEGWGGEDKDIYMRLKFRKLSQSYYRTELLSVIAHGDEERNIAAGMRNRDENAAINACYLQAKQKISLLRRGRGNLPLPQRRKLLQHARDVVSPWYEAGAREPLKVRYLVADRDPIELSPQMQLWTEATITVTVEPIAEAKVPGKARTAKSAAPRRADQP